MRIIAGRFKGRRLRSVRNRAVRSTADRVRESLFNILAAEVPDAEVLDLFCGAGTLGLEALSRGARHATFVDLSRGAIKRTRDNLTELHALDMADVISSDALAALRTLARKERRFSLIFADPPYGEGWTMKLLGAIGRSTIRSPEGILVIEHHKKEPPGDPPPGFSIWTERRFGDTMFTIWRWRTAVEEPSSLDRSPIGEA